ncbi:DUF4917 domain-containing protein [Capnocytophaga canimorsus]|uniref:DUF4917 family protein n=1 Tax=Capnocytophaga canimorsus TaxID=28188 RepID=UPI000D6E3D5B|nr:DUF4917 family protein [Capnocytophaga canimorsus]AWL78270.1 DUF4917 domain-containing protein [Capnocytophaga canimorsus]
MENYEELKEYETILAELKEKDRKKHLLFGNGFSISYDKDIFTYNALSKFIENSSSDIVKKIFSLMNTNNFELIMKNLETFSTISKEFTDDDKLSNRIKDIISELQRSLIDAIVKLHPENVFSIPENKSKSCIKFLEEYLSNGGYVFSTNYDLLLYWVLMRNESKHIIDGFGREQEADIYNKGDSAIKEYSELRWGKYKDQQNVFYLHGSLPIFDTGIDIIKLEYDIFHYLLDNIKTKIQNKEYPIFVTAGNGNEKLNQITHNKYLNFCIEKLKNIEGSLITFGFNFGEYDEHIIEAINIAAKRGNKQGNKLYSIYVGVYSKEDYNHIQSIKDKFQCKVNCYNAKTVKPWGV